MENTRKFVEIHKGFERFQWILSNLSFHLFHLIKPYMNFHEFFINFLVFSKPFFPTLNFCKIFHKFFRIHDKSRKFMKKSTYISESTLYVMTRHISSQSRWLWTFTVRCIHHHVSNSVAQHWLTILDTILKSLIKSYHCLSSVSIRRHLKLCDFKEISHCVTYVSLNA